MKPDQETTAEAGPVEAFFRELRHRKHVFWWLILLWYVLEILFIWIATEVIKGTPDAVVYAGFYGGVLLLYIPAGYVHKLECPYCHNAARASAVFTPRVVRCKSCGARISASSQGSRDVTAPQGAGESPQKLRPTHRPFHPVIGRSIRGIGIFMSFVVGFFVPATAPLDIPLTWATLPLVSAVCAAVVVALFVLRCITYPYASRTWTRPSWNKNPISWADPIQLFHLIAFMFLAQGLSSLLHALLSHAAVNADTASTLAQGIGLLIGVYLIPLVMPKSFQSAEEVAGR